jgi:hypothetical protein
MLKPPLSDFLLAGVKTERLLNVSVFLTTRVSQANGEGVELAYSIGACRITICRNVSAIWLTSEPPEKTSFALRLRLL